MAFEDLDLKIAPAGGEAPQAISATTFTDPCTFGYACRVLSWGYGCTLPPAL